MRYNRFIEKTLMGGFLFLQESLFAHEYASKEGFLQGIDPRAKVLIILAMLLAVLFSKSLALISFIYILCLNLAFLSSIEVVFFLKRTWFFIPLFALCIALPALFDVVTPGQGIFRLNLLFLTLTVTQQGLASAEIFFLRVLTCVSLSVLLVLTTRHYVLLKALRSFKVSQVFVMTIGMCYRYVYLFIENIQSTYSAIKSRVGFISSTRKGQKLVAFHIASLWYRSYNMHQQVYDAMLSRGYNGEPQVMEDFQMKPLDVICLTGAGILLGLSLWQRYFLN